MSNEIASKNNWQESLKSRSRVLAYLSASIFLIIQGRDIPNTIFEAIGILFLIPCVLLLLSLIPFWSIRKISEYVDKFSSLSLYYVTIIMFWSKTIDLTSLINDARIILVVPIILGLFLLYDIIVLINNIWKKLPEVSLKEKYISFANKLSFALAYFTLLLLVFDTQKQSFGNPVWYLLFAVGFSLNVMLIKQHDSNK